MKNLWILLLISYGLLTAQTIPNLPLPIGVGSVETWNDSIYYFGGTAQWSGDDLYQRIYKYDGSQWQYHDSIPDNSVWDVKTVRIADDVYLLSGWPNGNSLIRKYHLPSGTWTYLTPSSNIRPWGCSAESLDDSTIYLINPNGHVLIYNINSDSWDSGARNLAPAFFGLSSTVFQGEIYVAGYSDSAFYKYTPASDRWTRLANMPSLAVAAAMAVIDSNIVCFGGGTVEQPFSPSGQLRVYDISRDSWSIDRFQTQAARQWITMRQYRGDLYVFGGLDSSSQALDSIERIEVLGPLVAIEAPGSIAPTEISLRQNYPNPFNPTTVIRYSLFVNGVVNLAVYDIIGRKVRTLVHSPQAPGAYQVIWDGRDDDGREVAGGMYLYTLQAGEFRQSRKMLLIR